MQFQADLKSILILSSCLKARQQDALAGLKGICNIANDVRICGCGETQEEAEKDHDENLYNFLLRMHATSKARAKPNQVVVQNSQSDFHGIPAQQ